MFMTNQLPENHIFDFIKIFCFSHRFKKNYDQ